MSYWPVAKLGTLTSKIGSGATPRGGGATYFESGVAFIRSQNVLDHEMKLEGIARISDEAANKLRGVTVEPNDVLINITGDSIARCSVVDSAILPARVNQHVAILRTTSGLNPRFLQKFLVEPTFKDYLIGISSGGTRKALTRSDLSNIEIPTPPLEVQNAIADVLGVLDDKIAANIKISQTSNDLASAFFQRALCNAEVSNDTFADLAQVSGGGTPNTKNPDFWDGQVLWATPTDITGLTGPYLENTSRVISEAGLKACASDLYPKGTILMTSRATIGAFAIAQKPTAVNQGFIVVQPNDPELRYWLFHEMQSRVEEFVLLANGATFLELSRGNFKKFKVRQAPMTVMREFNQQAATLHEMARSALTENIMLAATRDALLPQLMSGKLRIKDAEKLIESVV